MSQDGIAGCESLYTTHPGHTNTGPSGRRKAVWAASHSILRLLCQLKEPLPACQAARRVPVGSSDHACPGLDCITRQIAMPKVWTFMESVPCQKPGCS